MPIPNFPCPECEHNVEYYDTTDDELSGRYRCHNCGRDTIWKQCQVLSFQDILKKIEDKILKQEKTNDNGV